MDKHENDLIRVQAEWNGWRSATIRVRDLDDVHWLRPVGAPRAVLHGYVSCTCLVAGDSLHECERTSLPHRLRVCILKRHTIPAVYADLARRAEDRPTPPFQGHAADVQRRSPAHPGVGR